MATIVIQGEQSWLSGESVRLPPMCPMFVGSLLCSERFFSGYSGFPLSSETKICFDLQFI